jgi:hypothetical protein
MHSVTCSTRISGNARDVAVMKIHFFVYLSLYRAKLEVTAVLPLSGNKLGGGTPPRKKMESGLPARRKCACRSLPHTQARDDGVGVEYAPRHMHASGCQETKNPENPSQAQASQTHENTRDPVKQQYSKTPQMEFGTVALESGQSLCVAAVCSAHTQKHTGAALPLATLIIVNAARCFPEMKVQSASAFMRFYRKR